MSAEQQTSPEDDRALAEWHQKRFLEFNKPKGKYMREVTGHKVNPANDVIKIEVTDGPGPGGANHTYAINWSTGAVTLQFQNGAIAEAGVNGITHEVLLAIVADRLQAFQKGPYACRENALALTKIEEAQHWLHHRTLARMQRGVEGTMTV